MALNQQGQRCGGLLDDQPVDGTAPLARSTLSKCYSTLMELFSVNWVWKIFSHFGGGLSFFEKSNTIGPGCRAAPGLMAHHLC